MKQTNVKKENERLIINLSTKKGAGYGVSKKIAAKFRDEKVHYKFSQNKYSSMYIFEGFYVKLFYPSYENGKIEICIKNVAHDTKKILDYIMDYIQNIVEPCEKNNIFFRMYTTFNSDLDILISNVNKKIYSDYCYEEQGNIYQVSTKLTYNLIIAKKEKDQLLCKDSLTLLMHVEKSMVSFIPNLLAKFFLEAEKSREEIIVKIEKV